MTDIQLLELLVQFSPEHIERISEILSLLVEELDSTKEALKEQVTDFQDADDYTSAREILYVQEALSDRRKELSELLTYIYGLNVGQERHEIEKVLEPSESVDYSQFDTDDSIAYDIENTYVTFKRPAAFSYKGRRHNTKSWKGVLSGLCDILYKEKPEVFKNMVAESKDKSRTRVKLSLNPNELTRPVKIEGSNIWIETNRSADNIRGYILLILAKCGIPASSVKVFFRRDFAALHEDDE